MRQLFTLFLCVAAAVPFVGCDDAKTFVKESREGYRELEEIAGQIGQIASAVKTNNFAQAKEYARKLEPFLNTRVLTWTVQILAVEERQGVEATRQTIEQFGKTGDITPDERAALEKVREHYQGRSGRTGDLLVLVGAVVVDKKFGGHGAGGAFVQLCQKVRTSVPAVGVGMTNTP